MRVGVQYDRLDQDNRGIIFEYFTANIPTILPNDNEAAPFLLELPIFLNWEGSRVPATDVMGLCSSALLEHIACLPQELPVSIQVTAASRPTTSSLNAISRLSAIVYLLSRSRLFST